MNARSEYVANAVRVFVVSHGSLEVGVARAPSDSNVSVVLPTVGRRCLPLLLHCCWYIILFFCGGCRFNHLRQRSFYSPLRCITTDADATAAILGTTQNNSFVVITSASDTVCRTRHAISLHTSLHYESPLKIGATTTTTGIIIRSSNNDRRQQWIFQLQLRRRIPLRHGHERRTFVDQLRHGGGYGIHRWKGGMSDRDYRLGRFDIH
mmetsp:Transcript_21431/g.46568  ORF Transcript_21431/g.46568 Transcript_21431/m.46568 type:complete len:208 (+) Transcript_21431:909-1532(+)